MDSTSGVPLGKFPPFKSPGLVFSLEGQCAVFFFSHPRLIDAFLQNRSFFFLTMQETSQTVKVFRLCTFASVERRFLDAAASDSLVITVTNGLH